MGSSNLRILPTRLPSCSSASNAILKKPSLISSFVKLVRSELRRLLMLTSSACEAPLMVPRAITIAVMTAAAHLGGGLRFGGKPIVGGVRMPTPALVRMLESGCRGMGVSRRLIRKYLGRVDANFLPRQMPQPLRGEPRLKFASRSREIWRSAG